ncbi:MAG TPA: hypothetical protein VKT33_13900 [Candidatus Angelobacter sp.]|nr:hypothetical protein [Candidatus Angelobacter sp.]
MPEENSGRTYHAGQPVPCTGLYRVNHYQHRLPHDVFITHDRLFPPCRKCGERVTFRLSTTANSLFADLDFAAKAA